MYLRYISWVPIYGPWSITGRAQGVFENFESLDVQEKSTLDSVVDGVNVVVIFMTFDFGCEYYPDIWKLKTIQNHSLTYHYGTLFKIWSTIFKRKKC